MRSAWLGASCGNVRFPEAGLRAAEDFTLCSKHVALECWLVIRFPRPYRARPSGESVKSNLAELIIRPLARVKISRSVLLVSADGDTDTG
eukprot:5521414-Pyramimonas_sp.AAC.1